MQKAPPKEDASEEEWWREDDAPVEAGEAEGLVNQVAARFRVLATSNSPAASDLCSVSSLQRCMASIAQGSRDCQVALVRQILQYTQSMQNAGSFEAVLFVQQVHFDESPLKLKVAFNEEAEADLQIGKVVAVQIKWCVLLRDTRPSHEVVDVDLDAADRLRDYLFLTGTMSSQIRASDKGTGEALAAVLHSCLLPQHDAQKGFKTSLLLFEADSLGANDRAIKLLRGEHSASVILRLRCLCHRVHTSASKTFLMWPKMLQGVARTLLVLLQQPDVFAAFRKALVQLVLAKCRRVELLVPMELPEAAQSFRENCLRYFVPRSQRGQVVVRAVARDLLNADWENKDVVHRCQGCCTSLADMQGKLKVWVGKLLKSLGRRLLNRGNWLHWQESLPLIGVLMSAHGLFFDAFFSAISKVELLAPDNANELQLGEGLAPGPGIEVDDADRMARWRLEQAEHRLKATEWLQNGRCLRDLYLCRVALDGEIELMKAFVAVVSRDWEVHNLAVMGAVGQQQYRVKLLSEHACRFMITSTAQMLRQELWSAVTLTEADVTLTWQTLLRPMSVIFQLVQQELNSYPMKIFRLLGCTEDEARSFLATPVCLLDEFAAHFLQLYDTVDKIMGEEAQQCLIAVAKLAETNTFKTESLHSTNSRKLSSRHHTHSMALANLAVDHFAVAAPSWMLEVEKTEAAEDWVAL